MAVCGALMRDLEWTKEKSKALRKDRKRKNRDKRKNKAYNQSLKTAVSSVGSFSHKEQAQGFLNVAELKWLLQMGETPGKEKLMVRMKVYCFWRVVPHSCCHIPQGGTFTVIAVALKLLV
jgi:hypothetical protein